VRGAGAKSCMRRHVELELPCGHRSCRFSDPASCQIRAKKLKHLEELKKAWVDLDAVQALLITAHSSHLVDNVRNWVKDVQRHYTTYRVDYNEDPRDLLNAHAAAVRAREAKSMITSAPAAGDDENANPNAAPPLRPKRVGKPPRAPTALKPEPKPTGRYLLPTEQSKRKAKGKKRKGLGSRDKNRLREWKAVGFS